MLQAALREKEYVVPPLFFNHEDYTGYCLEAAAEYLSCYGPISRIKENEANINTYENMDSLEEPKNICILDENCLIDSDRTRACRCILEGKLFSQHAFAGEATRLGLGTKCLINISKDLPVESIIEIMAREKGVSVNPEEIYKKAGCSPEELLPISLGTRHMLQYSFDIYNLAKKYNYDPKEVLLKQKMLLVLNEATCDKIIREFTGNRFFGFKRENVLFMVQKAFHGIHRVEGTFVYDKNSPKRLHNHGHMTMQQTMDNQIFRVDKRCRRIYLESDEFGELLKDMDNKISYNIEDLEYLVGSIDYEGLALALKKAESGYMMLMEIVKNNPENPQKGGMAAFDRSLEKNVMIEGFQLNGIKNHQITYLNKNSNHYPRPYESWSRLKEEGLNMPIVVKDGYIYFQPVEGDINFLVKTEFFRRKMVTPIKAWKSPATTPLAMRYMRMQDKQEGFKNYSESLLNLKPFYRKFF